MIVLLLLIAAGVLAIISLVESRGRSWLAWAVFLLVIVALLGAGLKL